MFTKAIHFFTWQVGKVTKVGSKVTNLKVGDIAGVGCMVDSCRQCGNCKYKTFLFIF
jgi:D-arabinose 1-dehydrogenase-like Zn-dependent alcohol dehydrogenase